MTTFEIIKKFSQINENNHTYPIFKQNILISITCTYCNVKFSHKKYNPYKISDEHIISQQHLFHGQIEKNFKLTHINNENEKNLQYQK